VDDVKSPWISNNTDRCEATGLNLTHGTTLFAVVKCVNNIELATTVSSLPVYISLDKPQTKTALVNIDPITVTSHHDLFAGVTSTEEVQSNQSCLQFHWDGFEDVSPITGYGYKILDSYNNSLTGWTDAGYRTMVTKCGLSLSSGLSAVAEVGAVNSGDHLSDTISRSILISSTYPLLTGQNSFYYVCPIPYTNRKSPNVGYVPCFKSVIIIPYCDNSTCQQAMQSLQLEMDRR